MTQNINFPNHFVNFIITYFTRCCRLYPIDFQLLATDSKIVLKNRIRLICVGASRQYEWVTLDLSLSSFLRFEKIIDFISNWY